MNLTLRWDTRGARWWTKRLRPRDTHQPNLHNVYALPTKAGWMMAVTVASLMLVTINYQLNLGYVLIFLLMGSGVIGLYYAYREMTSITLRLNQSRALRAVVGEAVSIDFDIQDSPQSLMATFQVTGEQPLPLVICETRYPLGLMRLWTVWRLQSTIHIDPPRERLDVHTDVAYHWLNGAPSVEPESLKGDLRAYKLGDAPRDLLWKTVAKRPDTPDAWGVRASSDASPTASQSRQAVPFPQARLDNRQAQDAYRIQQTAKRRDLALLSVLLFMVIPFFQHLSWWYVVWALGLISYRGWQIKTMIRRSPTWFQVPLVAGLCSVIWLQFHTFNGLEAGVSACIGLLGIKALELPNAKSLTRDHWVLIYLGLFTLAARLLLSQSLFNGVLVVMGLWGLLYILVLSHSQQVNAAIVNFKVVRIASGLVVWGTPMMLVLFFLFPRFAPLWSIEVQKNISISALSNEMHVGDISQIALDNRVVLRLKIDNFAQLVSKDIYLRGPVLPRFDGRTWTTYQYDARPPHIQLDVLSEDRDIGVGYAITLESAQRYHSVTSLGIRDDVQSTSPDYLQLALAMPSDMNPRTRQWVQTLQADKQLKSYKARDWSHYVLHFLQTGGYRYTLEPGVYGINVTDELLWDRKLGFCEHYASVFVTVMRLLGIPARVVTGYQGAETNAIDGLQVVRNSNAHAWAEYWDGVSSWVRADPTAVIAPTRIQNAQNFNQAPEQLAQRGHAVWAAPFLAPLLKSFWQARQGWEATNHAWDEWLLNYNQGIQMSWLKKLGFENPHWEDLVQLLDMGLFGLLFIVAAFYYFYGRGKTDSWQVLLRAARDKVEASGHLLPEHATARQIADHLPTHWPYREAAKHWLWQLEALRYGHNARYDLSTLKRSFKRVFKAST